MSELRLFPLMTVVFPGQRVPLHIFEPRYRQLVQEVLETDEAFGIVLIKSGRAEEPAAEPVDIGCTVRIVHMEELPDGRYNVICEGERFFRIRQTLGKRPYLLADVELLPPPDDANSEEALRAAEGVAERFAELLRLQLASQSCWQRRFSAPQRPLALINHVGARVEAPPFVKQEVLGRDTAVGQLELLEKIVAAEIVAMNGRVATHRRERHAGLGVLN